MKYTLLEMVQAILNDMDADEVSSINDTFESEQVAIIVRDSYYSIMNSRNWPHMRHLLALTATSATTPSSVLLPEDVKELIDIRFNKANLGETRRKYQKLKYLYPDEFLDMVNERNNDNDNVDLISTLEGTELAIFNDQHPQYWTSFNEIGLVFDAYDSEQYDFIPASVIQCHGFVIPPWTHEDLAVPDLPMEAFTLLIEEAKSNAFYTMKNMVNEKAESRSQKADAWLARKAFVARGGVRYPNYGRKGRGYESRTTQPLEKND